MKMVVPIEIFEFINIIKIDKIIFLIELVHSKNQDANLYEPPLRVFNYLRMDSNIWGKGKCDLNIFILLVYSRILICKTMQKHLHLARS